MRRLLAAASLAALGLSVALPLAAFAHSGQYSGHVMAWTASPSPTTANDGSQVYSNDELVAAKVHMDDGVKSWDVVIRPVNGGPPSTCHEDLVRDDTKRPPYPPDVYINCPWDTTRATNHTLPGPSDYNAVQDDKFTRVWQSQDLGPSTNGKYTIEITAYNSDVLCGLLSGCTKPQTPEAHPLYQSGTDPPRWREVWVVNGVSQPGGVTSSFDAAANKINVNWAPVPEPDVSYVVQEKIGDGKWGGGGTVPGNATHYERVVDQPGTYQYRVQAVRAAPTSNSGNGATATKRSDYAVAGPVEVAQITPPSTAGANNVGGGGPGGDQGVFLPGDTATTTGGPGSPGTTRPKGTPAAGRSSGPTVRGTTSAGGSTNKPAGTLGADEEGEGDDTGFSPTLPYQNSADGAVEGDDLPGEDSGPELAGGVMPKPHDTRQLMLFTAAALVLFVFAMQCTIMLRRSKPAADAASSYDDFDDWLGV